MKKIILLFVVGFLLFSVKSLVADEISDCLELEQLKAQREEIPYREAVEIALKICSIKANLGWTTDAAKDFDICLKNERIKAAREEIPYSRAIENSIESCSNQAELKKRITKKAEKEAAAKQRKAAREAPIFAIDVFNGNRTIKKLNIDFSTFGVLLDYYFTPSLSFTASYFLSSGENEINTNRDETYDVQVPVNENYEVQVPIYVDETYDVQVPIYVDETYDVQVPIYVDETYDAGVTTYEVDVTYDTGEETNSGPRHVGSPNILDGGTNICVFFKDISLSKDDCYQLSYGPRSPSNCPTSHPYAIRERAVSVEILDTPYRDLLCHTTINELYKSYS